MAPVLLAFLTPLANAGMSYGFGFVFVATNLAAAAIVWFFLYESSGLSLESVDAMYSDARVTAWHSARWAPAGWFSRTKRADEALLVADPTGGGGGGEENKALPVGHGQFRSNSEVTVKPTEGTTPRPRGSHEGGGAGTGTATTTTGVGIAL